MDNTIERGKFICFEGGEGAGKTTQIELLEGHLHSLSIPVLKTREPGGTPNAEALREVIVANRGSWTAMSEFMVMSAARHDHITQVIRPALDRGMWVLCDRFAGSSVAYQGASGELPEPFIRYLNDKVCDGTVPHLTFTIDVPPALGLQRAFNREEQSRFEAKNIEYHEKVRMSFLQQAAADPDNVILDGTAGITLVHERVRIYLNSKLGLPINPAELPDD